MTKTREQFDFGGSEIYVFIYKPKNVKSSKNTTSMGENFWPVVQEAAVEEDLIALIK